MHGKGAEYHTSSCKDEVIRRQGQENTNCTELPPLPFARLFIPFPSEFSGMQITRGPNDKVRRYSNPVEQVNRKLQPDATGEMVCLPLALVNVEEGLEEPPLIWLCLMLIVVVVSHCNRIVRQLRQCQRFDIYTIAMDDCDGDSLKPKRDCEKLNGNLLFSGCYS